MKVFLVTVVTLTTAIVLCSAADPECKRRQKKGLPDHFPNPSDCGRFYRCTSKNIKREVICPPEREYNPKTGKCALRGKGLCKLSLIDPLVEPDNVCNGEISGTWLPKSGNCRDYYICNDNVAYPQTCDTGSYFKTEERNCIPDSNVTCWQNKCIDSPDGSFLPDDNYCLNFYVCDRKEVTVQTCDSGSYFDKTRKTCIPDREYKNCWQNFCLNEPDGVNIANVADCHSYYTCQSKATEQKTCATGYYFDVDTLTCRQGECPPITTVPPPTTEKCTCPGGYEEGEFVPHPTDCTSFYVCVGSKLLEQNCQPGNYFDCNTKSCVRGECPTRKSRSLLEAMIMQDDTIDNDDVAANKDAEPAPVPVTLVEDAIEPPKWEAAMEMMCMDRYFEGDVIPVKENCQQFKICFNGELVTETCGAGSYFDEQLLYCQLDEDDACSKKIAALTTSQTVRPTTTKPNCTCPGGYTDGTHLPHPTDCDKYYICNGDNGELEKQECGVGNMYNKKTQQCVVDTDGSCWPTMGSNCTCPGDIPPWAHVPHPEDCHLFYICNGDNGTLELQDCGNGNYFDPAKKECVFDSCGVCNTPPDICVGQSNNTLLVNPTQCYSFYLCIDEVPFPKTCDDVSWFDPTFGGCIVDVNAKCRNPCENTTGIHFLPLPEDADCTKFYFCNDGKTQSVQSCNDGWSFNPTEGVCTPGYSNCKGVNCRGQENGKTFPYPGDDTKFYYCLNEIAVERDCLNGTIYDEAKGICLLQPSANCNQTLCIGAEDGLIAPTLDHQNASFCACRNGKAYESQCNKDYFFDEEHLICMSNAPCDPAICPNSPDFTHFPNKNDTHSFCMCISNEVLSIECPKNGTFNPSIMLCQLPAPQDPRCNQTYCLSADEYKTFPTLSGGKSSFCICIDGGATYMDCPPNHSFDEKRGICVSDVPPFDITKCQSGESFFPVPNNIHAFYYCSDPNTVQLMNCPNNTVYDDYYKACLADPCNQTVCQDPTMVNKPFAAIGNPYIFCYCTPTADQGLYAKWEACDAGTIFSPKFNVCMSETLNPDCNVTLCANADIGTTIPAINDPYGFCYCTSKNTADKYKCNSGMKYDPIKGVCLDDKLCDGKYTQYQVVPNPSVCNKYYLCFNGDLLSLTCPDTTYFNEDELQCLPNDNNQCPIKGDNCTCPGGYPAGAFLPHPTDCSLFYICSDGRLVQSYCGTGNYFDKITQSCVEDTTKCCPTSASRTCVGNYHEGEFVAHPTNTQSYYICTNARLMPASCGAGNTFDSKSKTCTRLPTPLTSYKWKRSGFEIQDFLCLEGQKRSVPSNCSQYELCRNGIWKRATCTEYTYYNPEQQLCLEPRDDTVCAYAKISGLPVCNEKNENALLPSKTGYCGSYLRCGRGKWRYKNCPKQHYFVAELRTCISGSSSSSNDTNLCQHLEQNQNLTKTPNTRCKHTQVRAYERDCAMYFMCLEGDWWFQYCPLGMYFNTIQNYCVPNEAGQCPTAQFVPKLKDDKLDQQNCTHDGALRASAQGCEHFYVCVTGKWHQQTCATQQHYNVKLETCAPADGSCISAGRDIPKCQEGTRRTYPLNCTAYERCQQGEWVRRDCLNGTVFDDVIDKCVPNDGRCASNGLRRACNAGESKIHPLRENCAEFYHCVGGSWKIGVCLKGYRYEQQLGACTPGSCNQTQQNSTTTNEFSEEIVDELTEETEVNPCVDKADGAAVPHPTDCGKFYLCYKGNTTAEQNCSGGSFFDAELMHCRPNDGSCELPLTGPCKGKQNGTKVPNPNDCHSYYECSKLHGNRLYICPEGEYYHTSSHQCRQDHGKCHKEPIASVCANENHGARLPHEVYCNIYYACVRKLAIPIQCPDGHKFNTVLQKCQLDEAALDCQNAILVVGSNSTQSCSNITNGTHLPDANDCTKYYNCLDGVAQHKHCDKGTFFDSESKMCLLDDGSCPLVNSDTPNHKPMPPDPIVCSDKHGDLMPDPANCNNFYACINGKLRHERCFEDHFFNQTTYQCQAYDGDSDLVIDLDSSEEHVAHGAPDKQCVDQPSNMSSICLEHGDDMPWAVWKDCRLYITCIDGQTVSQRCRNGENFDYIFGFCRQTDGTCQLDNGQRLGVCSGKHGQLMHNIENCRGYFVCINGQKIAKECLEGEYFNKTENACRKDQLLQCNPSSKTDDITASAGGLSCVGLSESIYYPNIHDQCHSYFQCIKGVPKIHECSKGMLFDPAVSRCVNGKVQCVAAEKAPVAQNRFPDEMVCANATVGQRYANKDDNCRSYFICEANGSISSEDCPVGMMFNEERDICEAADFVKCKSPNQNA